MGTNVVAFDDRCNQEASVGDLSVRLMEEFLREVGSELADRVDELPLEDLGRLMNVVGGPIEAPLPKNIGLLMFSMRPERFFPAAQIDVVYLHHGEGGDAFEKKEFKGPLHWMTQSALSHIERSYPKLTVIKHPDRAEADRIWNYPYPAIEEAVVNAVYHRSYGIREPVEVRVSPQELVVVSHPGPDPALRMEDIAAGKAVSRRDRNPRIGEFLKGLGLTEGRSNGIRKIRRVLARNGSPDPIFETDAANSAFVVRYPMHPRSLLPPNL